MMEPAVSIKGLRKDFTIYSGTGSRRSMPKHTVLDGIDLEVEKGEVVGILGANGSGKSTLLKIVSGILVPSEGTVRVNGKIASILELSMGFHDDLTGKENIAIRSKMYGIPDKVVRDRLDSIAEYADLGDYLNSPVRMYSSGMKARLAFAVMINVDADIFIIDEALSVGDRAFSMKAGADLRKKVHDGRTVLLTSHSTRSIEMLCTRAVILEGGRIVADGDPRDVCQKYTRKMMDTEEHVRECANDGYHDAIYRLSLIKRANGEIPEADRLLKDAASCGNVRAMSDLARTEGSIGMLRAAADSGDLCARRCFAELMAPFDLDDISDTMRIMAENGDHTDLLRYGRLLKATANGDEILKDALDIFQESYSLGNLDSGYIMAEMILHGEGTAPSAEKAVRILKDLSEKGHLRSMHVLAEIYDKGVYIDAKPEDVFQIQLRLAKAGVPESQFRVAEMYLDGKGTDKDEDQARVWFGRYSLSSVSKIIDDAAEATVRFGTTLPMDRFGMYSRAAQSLDSRAMREVLSLILDSDKVKDPGKVFGMCRDAAAADVRSKAFLADCFRMGIGTESDMREAFRLYKEAADAGDGHSMLMAAVMYRDGIGTERDRDSYLAYLNMAVRRNNRAAEAMLGVELGDVRRRVGAINHPGRYIRRIHETDRR